MKKIFWILIIVTFILVILVVFFYPKKIVDCSGEKYCVGYLHTYEKEEIWLNILDSVVENKNKSHSECYGFEYKFVEIEDGCPGDWGWYDERPFDCETLLRQCDYDNRLVIGLQCDDINNACIDITTKDKVPVNIISMNEVRR